MAKSKTDPKRKDKVEKFKQSKKQKKMSEQQLPQIPPVREVPVWSSHQTIEMNGLEFQAIFNYINNVQGAYGAVQSIMNRNILNGNVKMSFEKLNADKTAYEPMTDEEQRPHVEQFEKLIETMKGRAAEMVQREDLDQEPDSQEGLPRIDAIVDQHGTPVTSEKE